MNQGLGQFLYGIPKKNPCKDARFITLYTNASYGLSTYHGFSFYNKCVKIESPTDSSLNKDWWINTSSGLSLNNPSSKPLVIRVAMAENETLFNPKDLYITGFDINIQNNLEVYDVVGTHLLNSINEANHPNLRQINIYRNRDNTCDFRRFTTVQVLNLVGNSFTSINVNGLTTLKNIDLTYNPLTSIDVTTNLNLEFLSVRRHDTHTNHLTALNVTNNTKLKILNVQDTNLTSLDLTKNTQLTTLKGAYMNHMTEIDLSKCVNLTTVELITGINNGNPLGTWNTVYVNQTQLNKLNANQLPNWKKPASANYVLKP